MATSILKKIKNMAEAFNEISIEDGADNACDILEEIGGLNS